MRKDSSKPQVSGRIVLAATILGSGMAFIDGTVVNVALPALQNAFRASLADVQWVVAAYALMLAALLLVGGSLGGLTVNREKGVPPSFTALSYRLASYSGIPHANQSSYHAADGTPQYRPRSASP
ncbi:hypothetical protein [Edaphobacter aggregans]|uniref:hypothetical protein n=1 Tax=Edaphobacter aggregans TaxID=570835 RepID=UPI000552F62D|nr:hypothetical protein [Edaphobacter aggregans]